MDRNTWKTTLSSQLSVAVAKSIAASRESVHVPHENWPRGQAEYMQDASHEGIPDGGSSPLRPAQSDSQLSVRT